MNWTEDFSVAEGGDLDAFWMEGDEFGVYTDGRACVRWFGVGIEGVNYCRVWFA